VLALDIGRHLPKRSNGFTLATTGRGEGVDIFIPDRDISKLQCSFELTRPFTPGPVQLGLRFKIQGDPLGEGRFGKVYRAVDVDRGRLIAVKLLRKLTGSTKNEVSHLSRLNHVCFTAFPGEIEAN
jgi:hypothetical protein